MEAQLTNLPMPADVPAAKSAARLDLAAGDFAQSRSPPNAKSGKVMR